MTTQLQASGAISLGDLEDLFNTNNTSADAPASNFTADETDPHLGTIAKTTSNMSLEDYYSASKMTGRILVDLDEDATHEKRYGWGTEYTNFVDPENPHSPQHSFGYITRRDFNLGFTLEGIYSDWYWDSYPGGKLFVIASSGTVTEPTTWNTLTIKFKLTTGDVTVAIQRSWATWFKTVGSHSNHSGSDKNCWLFHQSHSGPEATACIALMSYFQTTYNYGTTSAYNYVTFKWT